MDPFRPGFGASSSAAPAQANAPRKPRKKKPPAAQTTASSLPKPYLALAPSSLLHSTTSKPLNSNPNSNLILPSSYIKAARPGREGGYAAGLLSPPTVVPGGSSLPPRNVGRRERPVSPAGGSNGLTVLQARNPNASSSALSLPLTAAAGLPRATGAARVAADEPRPRRKRRIVRPQVSSNVDDNEEGAPSRPREAPPATREEGSRRALGRGASMRRVNLWDDVPDAEEAPPPFPYPSPSTVRQPPSFTPSGATFLDSVPEAPPALPPERERSPPPSWEVATAVVAPPAEVTALSILPTVPPSATDSDADDVFASAPSSPTGTTINTAADVEEEEERRADRIMWNADLLAGYTLAERVERERLRRSRTVRRGKGVAGGLAGSIGRLRAMEPLVLPPSLSASQPAIGSRPSEVTTAGLEQTPLSPLPEQSSAIEPVTENTSGFYTASTSPNAIPGTPVETLPTTQIQSLPSSAEQRSGELERPAPVGTNCQPPAALPANATDWDPASTSNPVKELVAKSEVPNDAPFAEVASPLNHSPDTQAEPNPNTRLEASPPTIAPQTEDACTPITVANDKPLNQVSAVHSGIPTRKRSAVVKPTSPLVAPAGEESSAMSSATSLATPKPTTSSPTPPAKDEKTEATPPATSVNLASATTSPRLSKQPTELTTPTKPTPLFSRRPTISVSRPSPLSSGRARVQRRSSLSRPAQAASSGKVGRSASISPGESSIAEVAPAIAAESSKDVPASDLEREEKALPVITAEALPPNREAAMRRRDLLAKREPIASLEPSKPSPEPESSPPPLILVDLSEPLSLPPLRPAPPIDFGTELERLLLAHSPTEIKTEVTQATAGPSSQPLAVRNSHPSRGNPPPPPPPWRTRKETSRDELAEAFDDLMNFGKGKMKVDEQPASVSRQASMPPKKLAPTRRPPPPPPPMNARKAGTPIKPAYPYLSGSPSSSTSSVTDMAQVRALATGSTPNLSSSNHASLRVPPRLPPRPDRTKLNGPRAFRPPPPPPARPWARPAASASFPAIADDEEYPEPSSSRALLSGRAASVNDLRVSPSHPTLDARRASALDVRPPEVELEYTDLDVLASRLEGTRREYEGLSNITAFLGPGAARGASPAALSSLLIGPVEEESRRIAANGKVKLKLSLLGVRVGKCPICLSQFRENDLAVMLPACGHVGHEECAQQWLRRDARCFVCRQVLAEVD